MSHNHFIELKIDATLSNNQNDHLVTVSRKHNMIAGETIMISGRPGSNEDESVNHFTKRKMIDGNPKSIFAKIKSTFTKIKNQNDLSGNREAVNILQEAVNKLKEDEGFFSEAGNILQEAKGFSKFPGNILQEDEGFLPEAGNKSKEDEINLKELGEGMIFVETFRNCGLRNGKTLNSRGRNEFWISDCGSWIGEPGNWGVWIEDNRGGVGLRDWGFWITEVGNH